MMAAMFRNEHVRTFTDSSVQFKGSRADESTCMLCHKIFRMYLARYPASALQVNAQGVNCLMVVSMYGLNGLVDVSTRREGVADCRGWETDVLRYLSLGGLIAHVLLM